MAVPGRDPETAATTEDGKEAAGGEEHILDAKIENRFAKRLSP